MTAENIHVQRIKCNEDLTNTKLANERLFCLFIFFLWKVYLCVYLPASVLSACLSVVFLFTCLYFYSCVLAMCVFRVRRRSKSGSHPCVEDFCLYICVSLCGFCFSLWVYIFMFIYSFMFVLVISV